jgi:hypothetical protein
MIKINNYGITSSKVIALKTKYPCMTLRDIGIKVGVSRERVRQLLVKANMPTKIIKPKIVCEDCGKLLTHPNKYGRCRQCLHKSKLTPVTCDNSGRLLYRMQGAILGSFTRPNYKGRFFCDRHCFGHWVGSNYGKYNLAKYQIGLKEKV